MKFDQCLFGYDDGHRLLASSLPLGSETSHLTELSDLAPGTIFNQSEGYWTGLPVPAIGRYVLMRTWPAPEMSRPGCVWTHALLLEPALLESIEDLSVLQAFAIRPSGLVDKDRYREQLTIDVNHLVHIPELIDNNVVERLLLSLYAAGGTSVEVDSPGQLDGPLFAVWSQQWPRLRRNLRFQTAASRAPRSTGSIRFDVTAELIQTSTGSRSSVKGAPWLVTAALDVQDGTAGALRPFLWRYGRDVRRQRGSFLPLVEIRNIDIGGVHDSGKRLIEIVTESFSTSDDAKSLKQDLVDGNLAPIVQPQLLGLVLSDSGNTVFPMPTHSGISKLADLWPDRREEMLSLVEITVDTADPIGKSVFDLLTGGTQESLIWLLTHASFPVRKRIVRVTPKLLLEDWALDLESPALAELLPLIPDELAGVDALLAKLLHLNDHALAKVAFEHFPAVTAGQILMATGVAGHRVADAWWHKLKQRPAVMLQSNVLRYVDRTSQLYAVAELLGWLTSDVALAGPSLWISTFRNASNDLPEEKSDRLNCFLIAVALSSGDSSGAGLVETLFDVIHDRLLKSQLSDTARDILEGLLPDVGWFRGWDIALRFRLAIAKAYVRFRWSPQSYAKLSATRKGRIMLADAALDVPGGKLYAEAVGI